MYLENKIKINFVLWKCRKTFSFLLLDAFTAIARRKSAAGRSSIEARLDALGLSQILDILDDNTPIAIHILGAHGPGVQDFRRADVALISDPVALVERIAVVQRVIEMVFLHIGHSIDQIVGRLIRNLGVLLHNNRVVLDGLLQ